MLLVLIEIDKYLEILSLSNILFLQEQLGYEHVLFDAQRALLRKHSQKKSKHVSKPKFLKYFEIFSEHYCLQYHSVYLVTQWALLRQFSMFVICTISKVLPYSKILANILF